MSRVIWFWVAVLMGIVLLVCGYLVPAYIRATDASVLHAAGRSTPSLPERARDLLEDRQLGPAQLLLEIIRAEGFAKHPAAPGVSLASIRDAAAQLARSPSLRYWGCPEPVWADSASHRRSGAETEPISEFAVRTENRERLIAYLQNTRHPGALELLRCRDINNTVIFPPSKSSSGQAFDAALVLAGLLVVEDKLHPELSVALREMAAAANKGENPQRLEQLLLDFMSLGQRLNWGQLALITTKIKDAETLRQLMNIVRKSETDLPAIFSAVELTGDASPVTGYLMAFSQTGMSDLKSTLRYGSGGVQVLTDSKKRLRHSPADLLLKYYIPFDYLPPLALKASWAALAIKWLLYAGAGYLIALAAHLYLRTRAQRNFQMYSASSRFTGRYASERPFDLPPVRGIHVAREALFALGFLLFVLLLSEPFLAEESQRMEFPFHLRLPTIGSVAAEEPATTAQKQFMNETSLLALLLFFVLQALIYTACMFKLAEIRRQKVGPRMKIKLLDNEDHLFDAGLYLGFVGTIIALVLVSLGAINFSLMAAYSSTSFGIIFVSFFKIFNLRPLKRRLLLESEAVAPEDVYSENMRPDTAS